MGGLQDLIVWREAASLAANVESAMAHLTGPSREARADQMIRAADSIAANVAEGYGRGVSKDGIRFFRMARASKDELEGRLRITRLKARLPVALSDALLDQTLRVGFLAYRFEQSLKRRLG